MTEYKEISMLALRRKAEKIVREVSAGQEYILTYRGKPVIKMSPIHEKTIQEDDPFYVLIDEQDPQHTDQPVTLTKQNSRLIAG